MPRRKREPRIMIQSRISLVHFATLLKHITGKYPLALDTSNESECVRIIIRDAVDARDLEVLSIEEAAQFLIQQGYPRRDILQAISGFGEGETFAEDDVQKAERMLREAERSQEE